MNVTQMGLGAGISLTAIQTEKFKSATLSATFLTPLDREMASSNAIVPYLLRRGSVEHPTMGEVSAVLDELYGGVLEAAVRKRGETQCLGLIGSFLDEPYALSGEAVLGPAVELMTQLLLHPVTQQGSFLPDYVEGEKTNLIQALRAQMNDKRQYALLRLTQEMCGRENCGVDRLGDEAGVAALTPQSTWAAYRRLLAHAPLELHYCGSAHPDRVAEALAPLTEALVPLRDGLEPLRCQVLAHAGAPVREAVDHLDVTQGKLSLGFRTGGITIADPRYPALAVFNQLYGGTATSKLFLNVREKLSLCYYASSALESVKGILVVSSGVEFDKMDQARGEILAQLEAIRAGNFSEEELESARRALMDACKSALDSRAQLEQHYLTAAVTGVTTTLEELRARARSVTRQEVVEAAQAVGLDAVYRLVGKERSHD